MCYCSTVYCYSSNKAALQNASYVLVGVSSLSRHFLLGLLPQNLAPLPPPSPSLGDDLRKALKE